MQFNPKAPEYKELESLNPNIWRREVAKSMDKNYVPIDALTAKETKFDLHSFMQKVMNLKSDTSLYMGSATTPPCLGKILFKINLRPRNATYCEHPSRDS